MPVKLIYLFFVSTIQTVVTYLGVLHENADDLQ
ncbi:hypothetical protein ND2E_0318 [Colwellia psychrerythraea]|uniref:Uncharacterized protein n=1 Tax=Colwellia psychrerythraea TaxID=28229 RepID=A0A099K967_COLPS|nr:hypothetical protein ND2E_0318 [Colwellia psychrerythraea]